MKLIRFKENPIIKPDMDGRMGSNINGPSLIRIPPWIENPLGQYYLYFADHRGKYIRLAYSDKLEGPWKTYEPGVLELADSFCVGHIASPDVHVDEVNHKIKMYYHGGLSDGRQSTRVAVSEDGIHFTAHDEILGAPYFRVFQWKGWHYALAMPGILYRSRDGLTNFEKGPTLFGQNMRHSAVEIENDTLSVFYTQVGDNPERILLSVIQLTPDWTNWQASEPVTVLTPEMPYEGADLPLEPSVRGLAVRRVRQLRDPAIFKENGKTYLLYSVAGESGIAIAEIRK